MAEIDSKRFRRSGAEFDYDFGSKNNWRRWAWNRLDERILDKKSGVCLYLPSAEDIDREIATQKGFMDHNLIGVERSSVALLLARRKGLVIRGEWWEAVQSVARSDTKVAAVFADFCSGLPVGASLMQMANTFALPSAVDAFVAFNFMRGRDAPSNEARAIYEKYVGKHRGKLFAHIVLGVVVAGIHKNIVENGANVVPVGVWSGQVLKRVLPNYPLLDGSFLNPAFASYRSRSGQYFDSVVMLNPFKAVLNALGVVPSRECLGSNLREQKKHLQLSQKTLLSARAVLAHRTRRTIS